MKNMVLVLVGLGGAGLSGAMIASAAPPSNRGFDAEIASHARALLDEGKKIFRYNTFGSEAFWGGALQLHKAIAGQKNGGVGGGSLAEDSAVRWPEGGYRRAAGCTEEAAQSRQG